jgi:hypothetical protein
MKHLIAIVLCALASFAQSAELTLFDIALHSASRASLQQAIKQAGGKPGASSRDADSYDVAAIGLPDAVRLEVVYLEGAFVLAQYVFRENGPGEERLRKMLADKYGKPREGSGLQDRYLSFGGKFRWSFGHDMDLVYTQPHMGEPTLTYVNRVQQAKLDKLVQEKDRAATKKQAASLNKAF